MTRTMDSVDAPLRDAMEPSINVSGVVYFQLLHRARHYQHVTLRFHIEEALPSRTLMYISLFDGDF